MSRSGLTPAFEKDQGWRPVACPVRVDRLGEGDLTVWSKNELIWWGTVLGAGAGVALGVASHQLAIWLPLGTGVGMAIAVAVRERRFAASKASTKQSRKN
jgi:uncharacterized membrane protein YoaK (UPF0700 family)